MGTCWGCQPGLGVQCRQESKVASLQLSHRATAHCKGCLSHGLHFQCSVAICGQWLLCWAGWTEHVCLVPSAWHIALQGKGEIKEDWEFWLRLGGHSSLRG